MTKNAERPLATIRCYADRAEAHVATIRIPYRTLKVAAFILLSAGAAALLGWGPAQVLHFVQTTAGAIH